MWVYDRRLFGSVGYVGMTEWASVGPNVLYIVFNQSKNNGVVRAWAVCVTIRVDWFGCVCALQGRIKGNLFLLNAYICGLNFM